MVDKYKIILEKNGEEITSHKIAIEEDKKDIRVTFGYMDDKGEVDRSIAISAHFLHWTLV